MANASEETKRRQRGATQKREHLWTCDRRMHFSKCLKTADVCSHTHTRTHQVLNWVYVVICSCSLAKRNAACATEYDYKHELTTFSATWHRWHHRWTLNAGCGSSEMLVVWHLCLFSLCTVLGHRHSTEAVQKHRRFTISGQTTMTFSKLISHNVITIVRLLALEL